MLTIEQIKDLAEQLSDASTNEIEWNLLQVADEIIKDIAAQTQINSNEEALCAIAIDSIRQICKIVEPF